MDSLITLHEQVKGFISPLVKEIKAIKNSPEELKNVLYNALKLISAECTTYEYRFNLAVEFLIEASPKPFLSTLMTALESLLEERIPDEDDCGELLDTYFAVYYTLSLIYKKKGETKHAQLGELLNDKYRAILGNYPLLFEVHSRYYKRNHNYRQALYNDKIAIRILRHNNQTNPAVCISFASTVCSMLEDPNESPSEEDIKEAMNYINDAIDFNPSYPKYYFLKARALFFSTARCSTLEELERAYTEAVTLIDDYASLYLYLFYNGKSSSIDEEQRKYSEFKVKAQDRLNKKRFPRFNVPDTVLDSLKSKILKAESQDICVSKSILPPVPTHHANDKYFFVCYSSKDFKSVYCDLIELYRQKVPFQYDEHLTHGVNWSEQIDRYINNENCAGVVFYISQNVLSTTAIYEEMNIVLSHGKKHFSVNLEGSTLPSKILADTIVERFKHDPDGYTIPGHQMKLFLNFFSDDDVFTHKFKQYGPDGAEHFKAFVDAIKKSFPELVIGE